MGHKGFSLIHAHTWTITVLPRCRKCLCAPHGTQGRVCHELDFVALARVVTFIPQKAIGPAAEIYMNGMYENIFLFSTLSNIKISRGWKTKMVTKRYEQAVPNAQLISSCGSAVDVDTNAHTRNLQMSAVDERTTKASFDRVRCLSY